MHGSNSDVPATRLSSDSDPQTDAPAAIRDWGKIQQLFGSQSRGGGRGGWRPGSWNHTARAGIPAFLDILPVLGQLPSISPRLHLFIWKVGIKSYLPRRLSCRLNESLRMNCLEASLAPASSQWMLPGAVLWVTKVVADGNLTFLSIFFSLCISLPFSASSFAPAPFRDVTAEESKAIGPRGPPDKGSTWCVIKAFPFSSFSRKITSGVG